MTIKNARKIKALRKMSKDQTIKQRSIGIAARIWMDWDMWNETMCPETAYEISAIIERFLEAKA